MSTIEAVSQWNQFCGKSSLINEDSDTYWAGLKNQAERVKEELDELFAAIAARDSLEVLDAGADLDVVVSGLNFLAGHDYAGAIEAVLDNNDLKYTTDKNIAEYVISKLYSADTHEVVKVVAEVKYDGHDQLMQIPIYSVHRLSDDKICKLVDHPTVDLKPFLHENAAKHDAHE